MSTEIKTKHLSFHTGTGGMKSHKEFIDYCNKNEVEFISFWIVYHQGELHSHKPESLNYVVRYKELNP